jgi:hypothetical protein
VPRNRLKPPGEEPTNSEVPGRYPQFTRRSLIAQALAAGAATSVLAGLESTTASGAAPIRPDLGFKPDHQFPPGEAPTNPITLRVINDPAVAWDVDGDALVTAIRDELLVRASALAHPNLRRALTDIAAPAGSLKAGAGKLPRDAANIPPPAHLAVLEDTQLWRIKRPTTSSPFAESRRLNFVFGPATPPAVSPNHVFDPCKYDSCPGGPPTPIGALGATFIPGPATPPVSVVVIDTGYIPSTVATHPPDPAHARLDARVTAVPGYFRNSAVPGGKWELCPPDDPLPVPGHPAVLDGVAGHGTFIAGLIANRCPNAHLTLVGERRAVIRLPAKPPKVWSDELSVARSLLRYCRADVVSCGFAFPTFGDRASIPFSLIMSWLGQLGQQVAVVAPAGNENSARPYWPAADARVIGVGATDPSQSLRAEFQENSKGYVTSGSNWGSWLDCCARGQSVESLFVDWVGKTEDEQAPKATLTFTGWASWSGTSFAAPKVTAAIAQAIAGGTLPLNAFAEVVGSHAGPPVSRPAIPGNPPVALTNLLLG